MPDKLILNETFDEFDAFTDAVEAWDLELYKLDSTPFHAEGFQLITPEFIFSQARFNCRLRQTGRPPRGFRTITIPASPDMRMVWRGKHITGNNLLVHPKESHLDATSSADFNVFSVSINESLLLGSANRKDLQVLEERLQSMEVFFCDCDLLEDLRTEMRAFRNHHEVHPEADPVPGRDRILARLVKLISCSTCEPPPAPTPLRLEAIRSAERYIFEHADDPPAVDEICTATGVSTRTLEYAFDEYFGVTPKAYIKAIRLNAVRKQLRSAAPGSIRVADAANFWGFWHMGQFAADYRNLFGTNPSQTLKSPPKPCRITCPFRHKCNLCGRASESSSRIHAACPQDLHNRKIQETPISKNRNSPVKIVEPFIVHHSFTDFEALTDAVKLWNMDLNKLDCSPFYGELFQLISSDLNIGRGKFNSQLKQLGEPPPGFRTFTIPAHEDFWMYWRGREVDGTNLMAFPMGSEIDTVSDPRFDIFTISIKEELLFGQAASLGFRGLEKLLKSEEVFKTHPEHMARLRRCLHHCADKTRNPAPDATQMARVAVIRLIEVLATSTGAPITKQMSVRRLAAIQKTNRFIFSNPTQIPTVRELCKLTGVSQRTLEYAFAEHYGVKPKAYINAMHLNGVRKELIAMRHNNPRIARVANHWGFWHMGQLGKDYRKLFGQLPSETIK